MSTRTRIILLLALAVPLGLGACGGAGPSRVVERFSESVANGDLDAALPLISSPVRALFGDPKLRLALSEGAQRAREAGGFRGVRILSQIVGEDGLTAVVTAESTFGNGETDITEFNLVREKDGWKIHMDAGEK